MWCICIEGPTQLLWPHPPSLLSSPCFSWPCPPCNPCLPAALSLPHQPVSQASPGWCSWTTTPNCRAAPWTSLRRAWPGTQDWRTTGRSVNLRATTCSAKGWTRRGKRGGAGELRMKLCLPTLRCSGTRRRTFSAGLSEAWHSTIQNTQASGIWWVKKSENRNRKAKMTQVVQLIQFINNGISQCCRAAKTPYTLDPVKGDTATKHLNMHNWITIYLQGQPKGSFQAKYK